MTEISVFHSPNIGIGELGEFRDGGGLWCLHCNSVLGQYRPCTKLYVILHIISAYGKLLRPLLKKIVNFSSYDLLCPSLHLSYNKPYNNCIRGYQLELTTE